MSPIRKRPASSTSRSPLAVGDGDGYDSAPAVKMMTSAPLGAPAPATERWAAPRLPPPAGGQRTGHPAESTATRRPGWAETQRLGHSGAPATLAQKSPGFGSVFWRELGQPEAQWVGADMTGERNHQQRQGEESISSAGVSARLRTQPGCCCSEAFRPLRIAARDARGVPGLVGAASRLGDPLDRPRARPLALFRTRALCRGVRPCSACIW